MIYIYIYMYIFYVPCVKHYSRKLKRVLCCIHILCSERAMTTVDSITKEIMQVAAYLASQRALGLSPDTCNQCRTGM